MSKAGITAVIPVRQGSTRIKNKNCKPFAGSSLLEIKIEQLKRIEDIANIVVSSDSDVMLDIARRHGVIAKRRPLEFCDEISRSFNDVVRYIVENEVDTEITIWAPCVCPCIKDETFRNGIDVFYEKCKEKSKFDSVVTAVVIREYLFDENGPINFSIENHVRSQDLPSWHYIINGFFIAETANMANWRFLYGEKPYMVEIPKTEAVDIDDKDDFEMAEYLYHKQREIICKR